MFPVIPANKRSISHRKPVYGIGINDADYIVQPIINGKQTMCPYYFVWTRMLSRAYDPKFKNSHPTYIGCSVVDEWLTFTNFKSWMIQQHWEGLCLDKDIISPGNKVYGPETCCFVTHAVNVLLTDSAKSRGRYPQGVHFNKRADRFISMVRINGKRKHLGCFGTPEEASEKYLKAKHDHILEVANECPDPRIRDGLMRHAELLSGESSTLLILDQEVIYQMG